MQTTMPAALSWDDVDALAREIVAIGAQIGLPFVAAQSNLGDPAPMADEGPGAGPTPPLDVPAPSRLAVAELRA